jgi:hypothetical protein
VHDVKTTEIAETRGGAAGALIRLYWMLVGNAAAFLIAASEIHDPVHLVWKDALFVVLVLSLPAARWLDVRKLGGTTADGKPMTSAALGRYTIAVLAAFAAIGIGFHLLRAFWLGS